MPNTYTQETRRIGVHTVLGTDVLLLADFEGVEEMSTLFSYSLGLRSEDDNIRGQDLVGKPIAFWVMTPADQVRHFSGFVNRFDYLGRGDRLSMYRAQVVPWLWFLTRNQDCRIFQHKTIPEIVKQVFTERGFTDFDTSFIRASHRTLEYCVQYNESDFNFVSRLMERAGIYYFFRHEEGRHVLVLADTAAACQPGLEPEVVFADNLSERNDSNEVWKWEHSVEFRTGRWAEKDYDFKAPNADLLANTETLMEVAESRAFEVYEYPGEYYGRNDGETDVRLRIEAEEVGHDVVKGESSCRGFSAGVKFTMARHHSEREAGQEYVVTGIRHYMDASAQFVTGGTPSAGYENHFRCIPASVPYRHPRTTPRPMIRGPQTAIIVGPAGEEIYTDEFGRVKVQFHWDRYGRNNENSSCWMRVSQVHAGQGWGMMDLPRIGEEVIVSFLEGNPDRPMITGRVYNAANMPPFDLPAQKTRRGNMTKTYMGTGYNELSMDDTPGREQLRVNAQYDMNSNVNHDQTLDVGNNQTQFVGVDRQRTVGNNETITIGVNKAVSVGANHTETIGVNQAITVGTAQTTSIGSMKNETIGVMYNEIVGALKTSSIGAANALTVGAAMNTAVGFISAEEVGMNKTTAVGVSYSISAGSQFEITCGASKLIMQSDGKITLEGSDILVKGSGKIVAKAGGDMVLKGAKIAEN